MNAKVVEAAPATMVAFMSSKEYIANCKWFTQAECDVYGQEYAASGWTNSRRL